MQAWACPKELSTRRKILQQLNPKGMDTLKVNPMDSSHLKICDISWAKESDFTSQTIKYYSMYKENNNI